MKFFTISSILERGHLFSTTEIKPLYFISLNNTYILRKSEAHHFIYFVRSLYTTKYYSLNSMIKELVSKKKKGFKKKQLTSYFGANFTSSSSSRTSKEEEVKFAPNFT